jgi:hypothetical protein
MRNLNLSRSVRIWCDSSMHKTHGSKRTTHIPLQLSIAVLTTGHIGNLNACDTGPSRCPTSTGASIRKKPVETITSSHQQGAQSNPIEKSASPPVQSDREVSALGAVRRWLASCIGVKRTGGAQRKRKFDEPCIQPHRQTSKLLPRLTRVTIG